MAKRITDSERIIQHFMEEPLDVVKGTLSNIKAIIASREKSAGVTSGAAPVKKTRVSKKTEGPVQTSALNTAAA